MAAKPALNDRMLGLVQRNPLNDDIPGWNISKVNPPGTAGTALALQIRKGIRSN